MYILALEAYDGGSHGQFLDGLIQHSRHRFSRLSLPARKWKWRMRGAAITFAEKLGADWTAGQTQAADASDETPQLILTSDMTSVADLRALLPDPLRKLPVVCYFHENQLTYPVPDESQRDYQYAFTNITSCLAADVLWFNSQYHLDSFAQAVELLLRRMPDFVPEGVSQAIRQKAMVMPIGLDDRLFHSQHVPSPAPTQPYSILWNHRWEYDKDPDTFFEVLFDLQRSGVDFRLLLAGESFRQAPPIFTAAQKILADRIDHLGFAPTRQAYCELLSRADIVVSTAIHEFYGLSVREGIAAGACPLLPNRLTYPELIEPELRERYLYDTRRDLRHKLTAMLQQPLPQLACSLRHTVAELAWPQLIDRYDAAFETIAPTG